MTHRPHMPVGVKLKACLLLLGFAEDDAIEWHHTPALGLREKVEHADGTVTYIPDANDPRHIVPMRQSVHKRQTNGPPATAAGGDTHAIAKAKRIAKDQAAFRARLAAKAGGEAPPAAKGKRPWPKGRKLQSRPFRRPLDNRGGR